MSAAGDPLPSPTPSRPIPGHIGLGYLSEQIQAAGSSSASAMSAAGDPSLVSGSIAGSSSSSAGAVRSLADLHQEMHATTALLNSGLDKFSANFLDTIPVDIQQQARGLLQLARSYLALAQSIVDSQQAEVDSTSQILSSALRNMATKATRFTPPGALPTSDEYGAGLPALAYGVLERANHIIDKLLALAPADRHTPVKETVVDFINGTKASMDNTLQQLDNTLQQILVWHNLEKEKADKHVNELQQQLQDLNLELIRSNLGKDLVIGEKEKADKHVNELLQQLQDLNLELIRSNLGKDVVLGEKEKADKHINELQQQLHDLNLELSCVKKDLMDAQDDRENWKQATEKAAKDYEEKISSLKRDFKRDLKQATEKAAKDYEEKISSLKRDFKRDLKVAKDQMELAEQKRRNQEEKEAGARAARESAEKAKKMLMANFEDSMART